MTRPTLPPVPPERMTPRARAYLAILTVRHLLLGLTCTLAPQVFTAASYAKIKGALPVEPRMTIAVWGVLFLGAAVLAAWAAVRGQEGEARWALLASVVSNAIWAAGFIAYTVTEFIAYREGRADLPNPTGAILWSALTLKDITMLRSPLRNPFEPVMRRVMSEATADVERVAHARHRS